MTEQHFSSPNSQLTELIDAVLDDRATLEDWDRLSEIIAHNPQASDYFAIQASLHVRLQELAATLPAGRQVSPAVFQDALQESSARRTATGRSRWLRGSSLVIVIIPVIFALSVIWRPRGTPPGQGHLASTEPQIAELRFLNPERDQPLETPPRPLRRGEHLSLKEGLVEVRFANRIVMRLSAPCEATLEDGMNCILHRGKAFVTVPNGISGFRVRVAETDITDYGTEFGVSINEDAVAEVAVVKGKVGVRSEQTRGETQLVTGQGVTIEAGVLKRLYLVTDDSFPSSPVRVQRSRTIVDVRDNLRDIDSLKYYRVVPGAFREDARIYVDRLHEFNGMTAAGLPGYLRDADYLMTFNGDRQEDLRLLITLSQAADLYVLFDHRLEIPDWLQEYQRLPEFIGVDEQTISQGPERLGIGAGVSVDRKLSIWKKHVDAPGTVALGPVGAITGYSLMYSIVVVPHEK
ncbi:FecR domain-containing protein [Planctomicrobium sp. SH664]|uniref:FecR domain-containing protein n=1 Tax=Planctomicrobium sp. SH664 TaxID=3448125 RepID=UPI003F5C7F93